MSAWSTDGRSSDQIIGFHRAEVALRGDVQARRLRHRIAEQRGQNATAAALVQIGRASCRASVCLYLSISVVDVSVKTNSTRPRLYATPSHSHDLKMHISHMIKSFQIHNISL